MWLTKTANVMERGLSPFTNVVGRIGAGFIAIIMLITVADIIGRRAFGRPVGGAFELSELMLVIVVFGSMASCELIRGHITVGLIVSRFRQRTQDIIDSLMYLLFLAISCLITWQLFVHAMREMGGQVTAVLQVPVFPAIFIAAFGGLLLSLLILMNLLPFIAGALKK